MDPFFKTKHFKNSKLNKSNNRNNFWSNLLMKRNKENKSSNKILNSKLKLQMPKKKDKVKSNWLNKDQLS